MQTKTYFNLNDPDDPRSGNIELSIDGADISPPTQEYLDVKADMTSVDDKIVNLVDDAPAALDTLKELAQALNKP